MTEEFKFRRTITITLEGTPEGVSACNAAMGTHIPEALNFRPPDGALVRMEIREQWLDVKTGREVIGPFQPWRTE